MIGGVYGSIATADGLRTGARCDDRAWGDDFDTQHPVTAALVVEVAVSSVALARKNVSLYAEAGVEEYWIILSLENQIEVYTRLGAGRYLDRRTYSVGESLACAAVPELRVALAEWFV